ncbi:MAG: potassium transporter TrkG [Thiolinea sp.]
MADFADWPAFVPVLLVFSGFYWWLCRFHSGRHQVIRIVILTKRGPEWCAQLLHPAAQFPVMLGRNGWNPCGAGGLGFFSLYIMLFAVLMLLMMAAGVDQVTAFSAVAACINNVGPGLGKVAYSFAEMVTGVKWLGSFAMLLGRLEIFTVLVLFSPAFWRS